MQIIVEPIITETSIKNAQNGKFTFKVGRFATKSQVRDEVQKKYNVKVTAISTAIVKGRTQRVGKRRVEQTLSAYKKAMVTLSNGQKIDLFDTGS